jgi:phosphatidate phosphatase APP1
MSAPIYLIAYRGYGNEQTLHLHGRALQDAALAPAQADDSRLENLWAAYRRLESDEVAGVHVTAHFAGGVWSTVTNREGYFALAITPATPVPTAQIWQSVYLHWSPADQPAPAVETAPWVVAQVLTPPPSARFGVISDIDDTVLVSHAASPFKMALTALLNNARTRSPFPGVAAFYQALQAGVRGDEQNPIFYVSSSPWNFYDLLVEFMQVNEIPAGPLLLRDYGRQNLRDIGHRSHKRQAIDALLAAYPALPFVLLGDSGQEDPEIYASVVQDFPDRILGIHIRDVTPGSVRRRKEIAALAERTGAAGAPLLFSAVTADAVHFARQLRLTS